MIHSTMLSQNFDPVYGMHGWGTVCGTMLSNILYPIYVVRARYMVYHDLYLQLY